MSDVKFKEGTQEEYAQITPDEHTFYKVEREGTSDDVYVGDVKLSNGEELLEALEKIETLEESLIQLLRDALQGYSIRFVDEIPTVETSEPMTIYLIPEGDD